MSIKQAIALLFIVILGITTVTLMAENNTTGTNAGANLTSRAQGNVLYGESAGYSIVDGLNNVVYGDYAGYWLGSGRNNINIGPAMGYYARADSNADNQMRIGGFGNTIIWGDHANNYVWFGGKKGSTDDFGFIAEDDTLGIDFDGDNVTMRSNANLNITAATLTATYATYDSLDGGMLYNKKAIYQPAGDYSITASQTGSMWSLRGIDGKKSLSLPLASAGLIFDFQVSDSDSGRIVTALSDSIITDAGVAYRSIGTVAGSVRLVALDTVKWMMMFPNGTWTGDNGNLD